MTKKLTEDEKRKQHRQFSREYNRVCELRDRLWQEWEEAMTQNIRANLPFPDLPAYPPYPEECADLTCGAKTRKGTPCKRKDVYQSGR